MDGRSFPPVFFSPLPRSRKSPRHISFAFQEDSPDVKYVIQGIMPDYVIFTGAWDENFKWEREDCASAFNSSLVNILSWAKEYKVPRLCFLS